MRKGMVLFFILLLGVPTLTHAQSAKDALMGLKKLQARCEAGMSYNDYSNAVGEAKFPLNLFLESKDAEKYTDLSASFKKIITQYQFAGTVWDYKIRRSGPAEGEFIPNASPLFDLIKESYPILKTSEFGYYVGSVIQEAWSEASKELDNATKLFSKLGDKSSDETAKLKKEIRELKKEVSRLKEENDRLKNPKKVKKGN